MTQFRITNVHTHTFLQKHVPVDYPYRFLRPFKRIPYLVRGLAWAARIIGQYPVAEKLDRLYRFQQESQQPSQQAILENLKKHYPGNTRFIVLPMELSAFGYGTPEERLRAQHDKLAELARHPKLGPSVIPFATIDPRADPHATELWRAIDTHKFKGVKIYPRLGFDPADKRLMDYVYPRMQDMGLPLMTHCSRGGVQGSDLSDHKADRYTEPEAYVDVMRAFPDLRICLAHFGGQRDWDAYVNPDKGARHRNRNREEYDRDRNWQVRIRRMIESGDYPNLYTDISYTLFQFEEFIPFLRIFLGSDSGQENPLQSKVLFGSDYYMTRQEKLSERAVCFRLRDALGEEMFRKIAMENPERWLGERS